MREKGGGKTKTALPGFAGEKAMIFGKQITMLDR